jgi:hypothetical protein
MSSIRTRLGQAAAVATMTTLALAAPASAEVANVFDGPDATGSLGDIQTVRIDHRAHNVIVTTTVADLRRTSDGGPSSLNIWFDTNPRRTGPEFVFGTGLQAGTDYQLLLAKDWKAVGDPLTCAHNAAFDWAGDQVVLTVSRGCLGSPANVRIAERMRDAFDGSHVITDWMKGTRQFSRWVAKA